MKTYKYEIRANEYHDTDMRIIGRTDNPQRARRLADCGDCCCGGGTITSAGREVVMVPDSRSLYGDYIPVYADTFFAVV